LQRFHGPEIPVALAEFFFYVRMGNVILVLRSVILSGPGDRSVSGGFTHNADATLERAVRDYTRIYRKECGLGISARTEVV
jgi:hypothetical protein